MDIKKDQRGAAHPSHVPEADQALEVVDDLVVLALALSHDQVPCDRGGIRDVDQQKDLFDDEIEQAQRPLPGEGIGRKPPDDRPVVLEDPAVRVGVPGELLLGQARDEPVHVADQDAAEDLVVARVELDPRNVLLAVLAREEHPRELGRRLVFDAVVELAEDLADRSEDEAQGHQPLLAVVDVVPAPEAEGLAVPLHGDEDDLA